MTRRWPIGWSATGASATPGRRRSRPARRAAPRAARRTRRGSSSRSTTRAACTGTCGSSTTACSPPGRCRAGSRPARSATTSRCAPRTTRSSTSSSTARSPPGQYGAGTMAIWDRGTYEEHKFRDDEVMVTFHGERVRGRYVLFRTKGDDWMIHRMDPPEDPDREPMPEELEPMLARTGPLPPDDGRWAFEIKWDGVRAIAFVQGGRLALQARSGRDVTRALPGAAAARGGARRARGRARRRGRRVRRRAAELPEAPGPHAPDLRARRAAARARRPRALHRVRPALPRRPLADRPAATTSAAPRSPSSSSAARRGRRPRTTSATAPRCSSSTRAQRLEGVIAKRLDCPYLPGRRSSGWVKVKNVCTTDVVIGGWLPGEGGRSGRLGALVIGIPDEDGVLRYAGRVGTGFTQAELVRLGALLEPLARPTSPFEGRQPPKLDALRRAAARRARRVQRAHAGRHAAPAVVQGPARRRGARGRRFG